MHLSPLVPFARVTPLPSLTSISGVSGPLLAFSSFEIVEKQAVDSRAAD